MIGPDLTGPRLEIRSGWPSIPFGPEPSSRIATGYQPAIVATRDGKVVTGVVQARPMTGSSWPTREARITPIPKLTSRYAGWARS